MTALAIDAGGTSTRAVVLAADGGCLGYGRSGGGNPISSGIGLAAASMTASASAALLMAELSPDDVDTLVIAMAGEINDDEREAFESPMRDLGLTLAPGYASDASAMFFSGTWVDSGYVLIVGTGAAAVRIGAGEERHAVDGLGWLLGDAGSGFWIGHQVVRAALAAMEGRGPATALADLLTRELGGEPTGTGLRGRSNGATLALETFYRQRPVELARFAPLAFLAHGDGVADDIVAGAVESLAATLRSVLDQGHPGPVICGGGVLTHHPELARQAVALAAPEFNEQVRIVPDGLAGAAQLALRSRGVTVDSAVFSRIATSLGALRHDVAAGAAR